MCAFPVDTRADAPADKQVTSTPKTSEPTTQPAKSPLFGKKDGSKGLKLGREGSNTSALLRQMVTLVCIILAMGGASWYLMRKVLPKIKCSGGGKKVRVLETTHLTPRQAVHLLQVGKQVLLVSGGRDGLVLLKDVTEAFASGAEFSDVLANADGADKGDVA